MILALRKIGIWPVKRTSKNQATKIQRCIPNKHKEFKRLWI